MNLEPVIISAPFGNYLHFPGTTPTLGTFTRHYRGGIPKRLWKILTTLRYYPRLHSWSNKLGLPNPGIETFLRSQTPTQDAIVSIYGFSKKEWDYLTVATSGIEWVEFNLSCPNVNHSQLWMLEEVLPAIRVRPKTIIAKLPPIQWLEYALPLFEAGVRTFHLCNTIKTPGGGMSGKILKEYSLWAIKDFRDKWGDTVRIIGGGGITQEEDVADYLESGADHIALGSMLFNPKNYKKIPNFIKLINDYKGVQNATF